MYQNIVYICIYLYVSEYSVHDYNINNVINVIIMYIYNIIFLV